MTDRLSQIRQRLDVSACAVEHEDIEWMVPRLEQALALVEDLRGEMTSAPCEKWCRHRSCLAQRALLARADAFLDAKRFAHGAAACSVRCVTARCLTTAHSDSVAKVPTVSLDGASILAYIPPMENSKYTPGQTLDEALQYINQLERDLSEVSYAAALYLERSGHGHYSYQPDEQRRALLILKDYLCDLQGGTWRDVCQMTREIEAGDEDGHVPQHKPLRALQILNEQRGDLADSLNEARGEVERLLAALRAARQRAEAVIAIVDAAIANADGK